MNIKSRNFKKWKIAYSNKEELEEMLYELYHKNYYNFKSSRIDPIIFDVGALIGETVIYFKDCYPEAKITAFEPSPRSFKLLQKNVEQNKLKNVKLINAAVAKTTRKMKFYTSNSESSPWGRGDSLSENRFNNADISKVVQVSTVRLSGYLNSRVDLLKLDIEGAETAVLQEIESKLNNVEQIIMEFHGGKYNPSNNFSLIMNLLQKNGFKTQVFWSRWRLPNFIVRLFERLLSVIKKDEYWLRIYAQR